MTTLLEVNHLTKRYGKQYALNDVNLTIEAGQIVGLLGPNGSGKTTLIKIINGLLRPTSGMVSIEGHPVGVESKALVSYMPDRLYFNDWMTTNELMSMFADFYVDFDSSRAQNMLDMLNLDGRQTVRKLSKGNREKVQLILAMSRRARLYVLDEPIASVDPAARDYILSTIIDNYAPESSILLSTHLIADIERILDSIIFLQNGEVRLTGGVDDVRAETGKSIDGLFREVFRC